MSAATQPRSPASVPPPTPIQSCLDRLAYDPAAKDDLIAACRKRVRAIVRDLLVRYPRVKPQTHFDDIEQNVLIRLSAALGKVAVARTEDFLQLAAHHVRLAVVDILRKEFPRAADGRVVYHLDAPLPAGQRPAGGHGRGVAEFELYDLFDALDPDERCAINCMYLLGMSQEETAAAYGVGVRTVRRWWTAAKLRLGGLLRDGGISE